jgi:RND family efflux transporter MFP subunit
MTRRRLLRPALALGALGALLACAGSGKGDDDGGVSTTRVPVGLGQVVRDTIIETLALTGRLTARPGGSALLSAPAAGVVRTLTVQIGDHVTRGAVLAEMDVPELVAEARQTETAAAQAEREAARQRQLLADGITSARQAEEAEAAAEQAKAAAAAARNLLGRTRVTSPLAGAVAEVLVQRGERVEGGHPLVQVVAADTLDLIVPVPAASLRRLRVGLTAAIRLEGDSAAVPARVTALAPGVDSLTNAGIAVIRVPNAQHRLRPGAAATAEVRLGMRLGVLVVPDSAIVLAGDSAVVFVVGADSIAHQRVVRRRGGAAGRSEVEGDLIPGDRVVTTGAFGLQEGMRVVPTGAGHTE